MIIFYNRETGDIVGTIEGRVHDEIHHKMWIGDKETTDRLVINWEPVETDEKVESTRMVKIGEYIEDDSPIYKEVKILIPKIVYQPIGCSPEMSKILEDLEKGLLDIHSLKVDLKSKSLANK